MSYYLPADFPLRSSTKSTYPRQLHAILQVIRTWSDMPRLQYDVSSLKPSAASFLYRIRAVSYQVHLSILPFPVNVMPNIRGHRGRARLVPA